MEKKIGIAWYGKHFGEEPPISGNKGSGAIFFCRCNLKCVFCQNWQISQPSFASPCGELRKGKGSIKEYSSNKVVKIILDLQKDGAENINLVSPTPWAFWLKDILLEAKKEGLKIPVVWNSNGYEDIKIIREIGPASAKATAGEDLRLIDIYLPDYKYSDNDLAVKYSSAPNYPKIAGEAILEMYRQVGDFMEKPASAKATAAGKGGLIVRHLILPGQIENTIECLKFIRSISPKIHLSLMTQYNPLFKAKNYPEINRTLAKKEYDKVMEEVEELKFENGWIQEFGESVKCLTPDFKKKNPFKK